MKSSLKIDFTDTPNGLQPVIRVRKSKNLDDSRDGMLQAFFQKLGGESSWLQIKFLDQNDQEDFIEISPVGANEIIDMILTAFRRLTVSQQKETVDAIKKYIKTPDFKVMEAVEGYQRIPVPAAVQKCKEAGCHAELSEGSPDFCPDHNHKNPGKWKDVPETVSQLKGPQE